MRKLNVPKILIAAPTASVKDYCLDDWLDSINSFTYPKSRCDLFLVDNSDSNHYYKKLIKKGINAEYVKPKQKGLIARMAQSLNIIRERAIKFNYDYIFSLEVDIFPQRKNVIETLMFHRKKVVGALYDTLIGNERRCMIFLSEPTDSEHYGSTYWLCDVDGEQTFVDGTLKRVFHCGLGAVLIHKSVFKKIKFREETQATFHPDTCFAMDIFHKGIQFWCDTSCYCHHENESWGIEGWNYN